MTLMLARSQHWEILHPRHRIPVFCGPNLVLLLSHRSVGADTILTAKGTSRPRSMNGGVTLHFRAWPAVPDSCYCHPFVRSCMSPSLVRKTRANKTFTCEDRGSLTSDLPLIRQTTMRIPTRTLPALPFSEDPHSEILGIYLARRCREPERRLLCS